MTIRQLLVGAAGGTQVLTGTQTTNGNTITIPTHASGDMLVIIALAPTTNVPAGWTEIATGGSCKSGYKVAASSSETSGMWITGDPGPIICAVYRGVSAIGATAFSTDDPLSWPALTLQDASGKSWVLCMGGSFTNNVDTPPTGTTNRAKINITGSYVALHDTNKGVQSWSAVAGSSGTNRAFSVELKSY